MGFWIWLVIWVALVIGAGIVLGVIGMSLNDKATSLAGQIGKLEGQLLKLSAASELKPELEAKESDLLGDVAELMRAREAFLAKRERRRNQRQRRLERVIKDFDPEESRFNK